MKSLSWIVLPAFTMALLTPILAWSQQNGQVTSGGGKEVFLPAIPNNFHSGGSGTVSVSFLGSAQSYPETGTASSLGGRTATTSTALSSSGPAYVSPGAQTYYSVAAAFYYQIFSVNGSGNSPVDINLQASGFSSALANGYTYAAETLALNQITFSEDYSSLGPDLASARACSSTTIALCATYPNLGFYPQSFTLNQTISLTPGDYYQLSLSSETDEYSFTAHTPVSVSSFARGSVNLLPDEGQYTLNYYPALVSTPEPSTLALLGSGAIGIAGLYRRRSRPRREV